MFPLISFPFNFFCDFPFWFKIARWWWCFFFLFFWIFKLKTEEKIYRNLWKSNEIILQRHFYVICLEFFTVDLILLLLLLLFFTLFYFFLFSLLFGFFFLYYRASKLEKKKNRKFLLYCQKHFKFNALQHLLHMYNRPNVFYTYNKQYVNTYICSSMYVYFKI